jgi:tryptophanyl-tRNA synthetase
MGKKRVVSGMRASGKLHIGHYFGAIRNYLELQDQNELFLFIARWHGLTTEYKAPGDMYQMALETVADWVACGVDPNKCTIFMQDAVLEHAELHLLFSMMTPLGWLERVPTYKEQQEELKEKELNTYGFLGYPLLQAADIAIYRAQGVPVGQRAKWCAASTSSMARLFPSPKRCSRPTPRCPGSTAAR